MDMILMIITYILKIEEFPHIRFYDNGYAQADFSHNQGLGESLWPYTIYKYDQKSDCYYKDIMIDSWERHIWIMIIKVIRSRMS